MKQFHIPTTYRSSLISSIKNKRKAADKMKKDFTPTLIDLGNVQFYMARHFGFCYGVENAIEIAFRTVEENPGKRIFLLSEMIHNPKVNADLQAHGLQFLQDTNGNNIVPFEELTKDDIVIIPAFGTTLAIEDKLRGIGIAIEKYNTTCPFVEKVWNRSEQIAQKDYTIVIHGKPTHEETRATFSHAAAHNASVVVKDMEDAKILAKFITREKPLDEFYEIFKGKYSEGFDASKHLEKIGVVNQTTMLASDTQAIADFLKEVIANKFQLDSISIANNFADTKDTLCYATNDNQSAVYGLLETQADLAIVVGGFNSSNTSHLVELCEEKLPTYYIDSAARILDAETIEHFNFHKTELLVSKNFLPQNRPLKILVTSGASCPDAMVEDVLAKIAGYLDVVEETSEWESKIA